MTEDAIYQVILANGPAGDNRRYGDNPSMIERVARRQAKAVMPLIHSALVEKDATIIKAAEWIDKLAAELESRGIPLP